VVLILRRSLNTYYLVLPANVSPFDDVRVRQAVAMGLDRQVLAQDYFEPGTEAASHFTPCALANGCAGPSWYSYDPEGARALLAEAGYPDGFSTAFYGWYEPAAFEEAIQAQLAGIGIDSQFQVISYEEINRRTAEGTLDGIWWNGWVSDYPHVTNFLDAHFGRNVRFFGVHFPEIYTPLEQASQLSIVAAAPYYEQANRALRDLVPVVPLFHRASAIAFRADVENAHASPIILEEVARMRPGSRDTFVWLDWSGPASFYCADENDTISVRVCAQFSESLMGYPAAGTQPQPALATSCEVDPTGLIGPAFRQRFPFMTDHRSARAWLYVCRWRDASVRTASVGTAPLIRSSACGALSTVTGARALRCSRSARTADYSVCGAGIALPGRLISPPSLGELVQYDYRRQRDPCRCQASRMPARSPSPRDRSPRPVPAHRCPNIDSTVARTCGSGAGSPTRYAVGLPGCAAARSPAPPPAPG
jgi:hypothetical protein